MKKLQTLLSVFFLFVTQITLAQGLYLQDVNGKPIKADVYQEISGTPYIDSVWVKANIVMKDGRTFQNIPVKYNIYTNDLIFQSVNKEILIFDQPVSSFSFYDHLNGKLVLFRNGFSQGSEIKPTSFFQILVDGNVKVLIRFVKRIKESREYNSAITTKEFVTQKSYFVTNEDGSIHSLPRKKDDFFKLFHNNADKLMAFFKDNNINLKSDQDVIKIVAYYNTL